MPFSYSVDPVRQVAVIVLEGEVTGETILTAHRAVVADPAWRPGYARFWDYRGVRRLVIAREEVEAIRTLVGGAAYEASRAALLVNDDNAYVVTGLFGAWTTKWPVRAFWTMEDALAWHADGPLERPETRP